MPSSQSQKELDAVQSIHRVLDSFDPEARGRIIRAVTILLPSNDSILTPTLKSPDTSNLPITDTPSDIIEGMTIQTFLAKKKPPTIGQRLACLAYYMERKSGVSDVTSTDLTQANLEARQPKIPEIGRTLSDATLDSGLFAKSGIHTKRLTSRGIAVVEALPDQEMVKKALQEHPLTRKSTKKQNK